MINLKKSEDNRGQILELLSESYSNRVEDYVDRMHSIISCYQAADRTMIGDMDHWNILELIRDHLPTVEQAKKMFKQ